MNYETYLERKRRLATRNTEPTLTDQSQARDTDINIIVRSFVPGGMQPAMGRQPIWGADLRGVPSDLRQIITMARGAEKLRGRLPEAFREMTIEDLVALTPEAITKILTPPAAPPASKEESK